MGAHDGATTDGPTLHLEADALDPAESFCTEVFDDDIAGEYRVVQLTSTGSFDSVRDGVDARRSGTGRHTPDGAFSVDRNGRP
jgi:hypothetical protein